MNSLHIALNMLRRSISSKKGFIFTVLTPVVVLAVIIAIFSSEYSSVLSVTYVNLDKGTLGKHLAHELNAKDNFELFSRGSEKKLKDEIINGKIYAGIVIPEDFSERLKKGERGDISYYQLTQNEGTVTFKFSLDQTVGSLDQAIQTVQKTGKTGAELDSALEALLQQQEKHNISARKTDMKLYGNPALSLVIGFTLMFLMNNITNAVGLIVEDRRKLTMSRMFMAPVRSYEIALGNFLGSFLQGTIQVLLLLLFTKYILHFDYRVDFLSLFVVLEFFMLTAMGFASAAASLIKNTSNLGAINNLIITPTCMIGGCYWPVEVMPKYMQKLSNFVPQKWAINAVERLVSGAHLLPDLGLHLGILTLFAIILLAIGSAALRPGDAAKS